MDEKLLDGFIFLNDEDYELALSELEKIKYISEKLNKSNLEGVLQVYNKMAQGKIFVTPIGIEYLRELQRLLLNNPQIDDSRIAMVPVNLEIVGALRNSGKVEEPKEKKEPEKKPRKSYKQQYKTSLIFSVAMAIVVIAMYVIALKSDYPNIINYRENILNEYSGWEQELREREQIVKDKELELGLK